MAVGISLSSSLLSQVSSSVFTSPNRRAETKSTFHLRYEKRNLFRRLAKRKISFVDQILDYIEGGPKLRKWYGAPDLLPKDGSFTEDSEEAEENEEEEDDEEDRDAVLVTDGDSDIGQMVILQLIVKRTRVKALVKDKRTAMEAFGTYVESMSGDPTNKPFLRKVLKGVRAVISPTEGFLSNAWSLRGVKHIILLSQLYVYGSSGGIKGLMANNAKKLLEQDESAAMSSAVPYTIIRTGKLENRPGGKQGFNFDTGSAAKGSLSKEDAAVICVEALSVIPPKGLIFEATNGEEVVSNWEGRLIKLMEMKKRDN